VFADLAAAGRVDVPHVQPQRPVIPEHSAHFAECGEESGHVLLRCGLESRLLADLVVADRPVRWRCDASLDATRGKFRQSLESISFKNAPTGADGSCLFGWGATDLHSEEVAKGFK
jgi:hypothetical protein